METKTTAVSIAETMPLTKFQTSIVPQGGRRNTGRSCAPLMCQLVLTSIILVHACLELDATYTQTVTHKQTHHGTPD
jgi:hypothetical protein